MSAVAGSLIAVWLAGCGGAPSSSPGSPAIDLGTGSNTRTVHDGKPRHLFSEVRILSQNSNEAGHQISASSISIVPREFGSSFSISGVNEMYILNSHIEVFPNKASNSGTTENQGDEDISDTLRDYIDTLPEEFGFISRIHMRNVRITLHEAGRDGAAVKVLAGQLVKELANDSDPLLYSVQFFEGQSTAGLEAASARWIIDSSQFVVMEG